MNLNSSKRKTCKKPTADETFPPHNNHPNFSTHTIVCVKYLIYPTLEKHFLFLTEEPEEKDVHIAMVVSF